MEKNVPEKHESSGAWLFRWNSDRHLNRSSISSIWRFRTESSRLFDSTRFDEKSVSSINCVTLWWICCCERPCAGWLSLVNNGRLFIEWSKMLLPSCCVPNYNQNAIKFYDNCTFFNGKIPVTERIRYVCVYVCGQNLGKRCAGAQSNPHNHKTFEIRRRREKRTTTTHRNAKNRWFLMSF